MKNEPTKLIIKQKCGRCRWTWWPGCPLIPARCPACGSPYWNKSRVREWAKNKMAKPRKRLPVMFVGSQKRGMVDGETITRAMKGAKAK